MKLDFSNESFNLSNGWIPEQISKVDIISNVCETLPKEVSFILIIMFFCCCYLFYFHKNPFLWRTNKHEKIDNFLRDRSEGLLILSLLYLIVMYYYQSILTLKEIIILSIPLIIIIIIKTVTWINEHIKKSK